MRRLEENRFGCMESLEIPTLEIPTSSSDGRCFSEGFGRSVVARLRSSKRGGHTMLAALRTRRNCHGPTPTASPGPQSALELGARAPMRQPYRGATRGVGRLELGPSDAAFRHVAQGPMIQNSAAGTDDDGHGKICRTHGMNMLSTRREGYAMLCGWGRTFAKQTLLTSYLSLLPL